VLLPDKPVLEPKAIAILKAASDRLAAARTMTFTAIVTYESPARTLQPLAYTTLSKVTLQRPDKLRVITPGDGPPMLADSLSDVQRHQILLLRGLRGAGRMVRLI
jgi:hypothetical protein